VTESVRKEEKQLKHVKDLWRDEEADKLKGVDRLVYRSNTLGSDLTLTNTGGGNTSSKLMEKDPRTGESVEVLWVKGSGGDLRTAKRDGLLQEWAAAFQFPYYFGGTWDAFEECLNDLDWLPASAYIALVTNFDRVLADDLTELTTFAGVLEMAAKEWTRPERHQDPHPPVPFRVVLHSKPANESLSVERFRIAGMEPAFRGLQRLPNDFDEPES
jgi:hypothetical protein